MRKKLTIEEMHELAKKRNGKCISKKYINCYTKLKWKCEKGHIWGASPNKVKLGRWCHVCGGTTKLTIEVYKKLAIVQGGKCLSKKYTNSNAIMEWQCNKGHNWEATGHYIKSGYWCPYCNSGRKTIKDMQKLALGKGGKCLSKEYLGANTNLKWKCKEGYIWETKPAKIIGGSWCPHCYGNVKYTINNMQELAKSNGGKCLSKEYFNAYTKLKWQCNVGHIWYTIPTVIRNGSWCPSCSAGVSERICRKYFERIFNEKFPNSHPAWLRNSAGNIMELDGYCEKLNIAFEYNGEQHYQPYRVLQIKKSLNERKKDDKLKRKLCKSHNVTLIEIPFWIGYENMEKFITEQCKKNGVTVPKLNSKINYKLFNIYSPTPLEEVKRLAESRGGKCLSKIYINARMKLKFQCKEGHVWETTSDQIKNEGSWCPYCYGNVRLNIMDMHKLAKLKRGKCLSKKYFNNRTKLKWQCNEGHVWETTPYRIQIGRWCRIC